MVEALEDAPNLAGRMFIGFPIIPTATGRQAVDALWLSEQKGIVIFDLVEGELENYQDRQDDAANAIDGRLRLDRRLVDRRDLRVPIHTLSFAPQCTATGEDGYLVTDRASLAVELANLANWENARPDVFKAALSTIENVSTIRRSASARTPTAGRGAIVRRLEDAIATLDPWQSRAVVETIDGVQRIRGLAGSGKTIVLALKAAYLHTLHPEWRIAITFHTRSLKGAFERLVRDFHIRYAGEEPDWSCLEVVNAWGTPSGPGIYSEFCRRHRLDYLDFRAAERISRKDPFAGACARALAAVTNSEGIYDAILVDEAQDLSPSFLRLCYSFLKKPRRLVYAYDELQRLSGEFMPSPEKLFGSKANGQPRVRLRGRQDIVLRTCYRNSRPILVTAHAIGFGIYRQPPKAIPGRGRTGLVQMFDHASLWRDVGYNVKEGELADGQAVLLQRDSSASPAFLEEHSSVEDLVQFHVFDNDEEQAQWIVAEIDGNLRQDGLRHEDIVVINPDPRTTRRKVGSIRSGLLKSGINCHLAGVDTSRDTFFVTDHASVTLTGVYRAKGNEAAMVYIVNAEAGVTGTYDVASVRNRLFTAITRSKAWVRIAGVGPAMEKLKREYEQLVKNDFELRFRYPTANERAEIRTVHRDLSPQEREKQRRRNTDLKELIRDLSRGDCRIDDIEPNIREQLLRMLSEEP